MAFGPPTSLDAAIATTQAFQADTVGRYIRHYRRNLAFTGGVVLWNYTSTWPSVCWALIDFYRRPKHAYYECKRCFEPFGVGIEPTDASQSRYVAHVSLDRAVADGGELAGELLLELRELESGKVLKTERTEVSLAAPGAVDALELDLPGALDRRRYALVATLTHTAGTARDFRYLVPLAELRGLGGKLRARRLPDGVELQASGWRLRVGVESFEPGLVWNDNYFDLLPGETRTLHVSHRASHGAGHPLPEHLWIVADMSGSRVALPEAEWVEL
jgi:beta-mannosidase